MYLYKKAYVNHSALCIGRITLNSEARDYLLETTFRYDQENRDATLLICNNQFKARLMNVPSSHSVQLSYEQDAQKALQTIFIHATEYYKNKRDEATARGESTRVVPEQEEESISIEETAQPFVYTVNCYPRGRSDCLRGTSDTSFLQVSDIQSFPEGRRKYALHAKYERSPLIIEFAKRSFLKAHGRLYCEVCGFSFSDTYGAVGDNFIEAHHTIPVSELGDDGQTKVTDIRLVCSNCHRMLHRKRPWLTTDQLNEVLDHQ